MGPRIVWVCFAELEAVMFCSLWDGHPGASLVIDRGLDGRYRVMDMSGDLPCEAVAA